MNRHARSACPQRLEKGWLTKGGELLQQRWVSDRDVQNTSPNVAQPGFMAMWFANSGVPRFLELGECPQPAIASYGEKLTENLGQGSRAPEFRVRHAGSFRFHPRKGGEHDV